jgi:hypothetical protein
VFELLKQMSSGSETDPDKRIAELTQRRDAIETEIARIREGDLPLLDDTALRDRFQQFMQVARELLTDFREVEHNFRQLDRRLRERIALWEGRKGELLDEIMGERDAISDSDQGKSFRAFWDFLMSSRRQEELTELLDRVLALAPIADLKPDARTRRVHYDWLEAGEHTQRTVAQLSQQLRRFLDDQAWLENRRIMDILHGIEAKSLALREAPPAGSVMTLAAAAASIDLPMERRLHTPARKPVIAEITFEADGDALDPSVLYAQAVVDKSRLARHIRQGLQTRDQITLRELLGEHPLTHGLAELVAYLQLGAESFNAVVDETSIERIAWDVVKLDGTVARRQARLPRVIFAR